MRIGIDDDDDDDDDERRMHFDLFIPNKGKRKGSMEGKAECRNVHRKLELDNIST